MSRTGAGSESGCPPSQMPPTSSSGSRRTSRGRYERRARRMSPHHGTATASVPNKPRTPPHPGGGSSLVGFGLHPQEAPQRQARAGGGHGDRGAEQERDQ